MTHDDLEIKIEQLKGCVTAADYEKIFVYAFELACHEADYLEIDKEGEAFEELCNFRRMAVVDEVYIIIRDSISHPTEICLLEFDSSPEQCQSRIKRIYGDIK